MMSGKTGFVYFAGIEDEAKVKIGWTAGKPASRIKQLQTGSAARLVLLAAASAAEAAERSLHSRFSPYRLTGEWFELSDEIRDLIQRCNDDPDGALNGVGSDSEAALPEASRRLRAAIRALGLTQKAAADQLGIKQPSLHDYLSGKRTPTLDWLHGAGVMLGIDPAELDERLASRKPRKKSTTRA